jgi:hypothetical protein
VSWQQWLMCIVTSDARGTASRELQASTRKGRATLVDALPTTVHHADSQRTVYKKTLPRGDKTWRKLVAGIARERRRGAT